MSRRLDGRRLAALVASRIKRERDAPVQAPALHLSDRRASSSPRSATGYTRPHMSEAALLWAIVGGVVLVALAYLAITRNAERRQTEHFAALAAHCGASVERESEFSWFFRTTVGDREVTVSTRRYVSVVTTLRGRAWDLHSVRIRMRLFKPAADSFEDAIKVDEFGFPMSEGWLTSDVASAVTTVFESAQRRGDINIEGGKLVYRRAASPRSFSPDAIAALVRCQSELAAALERGR